MPDIICDLYPAGSILDELDEDSVEPDADTPPPAPPQPRTAREREIAAVEAALAEWRRTRPMRGTP